MHSIPTRRGDLNVAITVDFTEGTATYRVPDVGAFVFTWRYPHLERPEEATEDALKITFGLGEPTWELRQENPVIAGTPIVGYLHTDRAHAADRDIYFHPQAIGKVKYPAPARVVVLAVEVVNVLAGHWVEQSWFEDLRQAFIYRHAEDIKRDAEFRAWRWAQQIKYREVQAEAERKLINRAHEVLERGPVPPPPGAPADTTPAA